MRDNAGEFCHQYLRNLPRRKTGKLAGRTLVESKAGGCHRGHPGHRVIGLIGTKGSIRGRRAQKAVTGGAFASAEPMGRRSLNARLDPQLYGHLAAGKRVFQVVSSIGEVTVLFGPIRRSSRQHSSAPTSASSSLGSGLFLTPDGSLNRRWSFNFREADKSTEDRSQASKKGTFHVKDASACIL
jgi:hypothetical protein